MTYQFYFFVGKFPKLLNFSDSMEKNYLVELNIFKENAIYGLQEILLNNFTRNFYIWSAIVNGACMQKIKIGHRAKEILSADFISGSRDFTQDLTSGVLILIHSADAFVLVMACVDCARACS